MAIGLLASILSGFIIGISWNIQETDYVAGYLFGLVGLIITGLLTFKVHLQMEKK